MKRECELEGNYRYLLRIPISGDTMKVLFILCNPSTADAMRDDTTTRNLQKWARQNRVGTVIVANLYAYRSSRPSVLMSLSEDEAIGEKNMDAIIRASIEADEVIMGWGNPPKSRSAVEFQKRISDVLSAVRTKHPSVYCIGTTKQGSPRHPRVWYMTKAQEKVPYACS